MRPSASWLATRLKPSQVLWQRARQGLRVLLVTLLGASCALGADIRPIGVVGNSGLAGEHLLRVSPFDLEHSTTGVAIDWDGALWLSGGGAINRVSLDGRLIARYALDPPGNVVESGTFAVMADRLYFLGREPGGRLRLFGLSMAASPGEEPARAAPADLPPRRREHTRYCLAAQPLDGRLVLALEEPGDDEMIGVYFVNPQAGSELAFTLPGSHPQGAAVDPERGVIYVGADFGLFVGGETHSTKFSIVAVDRSGAGVSDSFPAACTKTPALPTQFRGVVSLAGGALWDTAWYGFLARLDLNARGAPGRVVQWHHELGYPSQIARVPGSSQSLQRLAITTANADALYLARWNEADQSLALGRRIGCLPVISNLGLSPDGWVTVATARAQLWWRWDDPPDAAPHKAELHVGITPVHWDGDRFFALAAQYRLDDMEKRNAVGTIFKARLGDRNEAHRVTDPIPLKRPVGLSVAAAPGENSGTLYVTDAETSQLYCTDFWLPELKPNSGKWTPLAPTDIPLRTPTDVQALADDRLMLADAGRILFAQRREDGLAVSRRLDRWGDAPDQRFGSRLHFAVDGRWMLVSDTDRHRLVWLDWVDWTVLGQFGEVDVAGDDARHLDTPAQVALSGIRALVADTGNQRALKLELVP